MPQITSRNQLVSPALDDIMFIRDVSDATDDPTGTDKYIEAGDLQTAFHVGARVYNNANISIPNAAWTALTFNSEKYDTGGFHSIALNTDRFTIPATGIYLLVGEVMWDDNSTGDRYVGFKIDGGAVTPGQTNVASRGTSGVRNAIQHVTTLYQFTAGQYVVCEVYQSSGGALNVMYWADERSPVFMIQRVG